MTIENRIDGAILSLVDIDALKHQVSAAEWARDYAKAIVEAVQVPLMVLDEDMRVLSANQAFYQAYGASVAETVAKSLFELNGGAWDMPGAAGLAGQMLARNTLLEGLGARARLPPRGKEEDVALRRAPSIHPPACPCSCSPSRTSPSASSGELERAELLARCAAGEGGGRAGQPREGPVPGHPVPRAPHAALHHADAGAAPAPMADGRCQAQARGRGHRAEHARRRRSSSMICSTSRASSTGKLRMQLQTSRPARWWSRPRSRA